MLMNRVAGRIVIALSDSDFQWCDWKGFLADLKLHIPRHEREYDPEDRQWYIKATRPNISILEQLKAQYFSEE